MHRKPIVVGLASAVLVLSAGGAFAYWTTTGIGSSTATVGTIKPLEIKAVDVVGLVLGKSVPITGEIINPNDFEASLIGTHITMKVIVDKEHSGCDLANFESVAPSTKAKLIKANDSVKLDEGSITMLNTKLDQAACQGATLTFDYLLK